MEKGNKTDSAFDNTSSIFYRQNGRIALRTFLENLRENGDANADNKQITQCVFLGALCLKPVPDIFHVALQPYTFKTRTRSVFCNNAEGLNPTHRPARKQPRKNTRRTTNVLQKNPSSSRILDLFDNSQTLFKLGLNTTTSKQPDKLALENAVVPIEKHVRKTRKMDVKTKQLPVLVPVKETIDLETKNGDLQKLQPILIELDEDEIEDYLEVDQNVVADLEALIPDEEIEFLSNSLIKPINENEPEEIKDVKQDNIETIKLDDEPKVNQSLETIAIKDCEIVENVEISKSVKSTEVTPEVKDNGTNLSINIPDERKDYETRTLRSGVKVSPPYSSVKSRRSQIPKLIPVKKKEVSKENEQKEEIPIHNEDSVVIVEDVPKNEEKLPIPTIVLDDNVKEEEVIEISINKTADRVTEDKYEKNLSIFEKMMKDRSKKTTPTNKKQRKTRLNPRTRIKAKKIEENPIIKVQKENIVDLSVKNEEIANGNKVERVISDDKVEEIIIEDKIEKRINNGNIDKVVDKVEGVINVDDEEEEEIIDVEKIEETIVQVNNNIEPNDSNGHKRRNKTKTKNGEKAKKKKPRKTNINPEQHKNREIPIEHQTSELAKHLLTNNNETTKEMKRINEEENATLRKKRKTKIEEEEVVEEEEEETAVSSPGSSEFSLENKDPDVANNSKVEMESPEDQMEYRSKEPYRRIYRCRVCLIVFETYNKLKAHKAVHDVENPYQCQECGKSYDDVEELAAHLRIHKGKMPYPCKKCDSSFWTSVQLERHQMVHVLKKVPLPNNSAPKRIFKCEECGKEFKKICDLERHTRVHTGEKPSVCNICNKRFQQAYNLNKHLLIHTQEKNFECIICQKKFGRNDVLNRHVLTHSIDKPFHCSICSKTFIRNTQLNLHIRKHHGLKSEATTDESGAGKSSD